MRLVVASGNKNKLREIAEIFTDFEVVSQKEMGFNEDVEETGLTFAENALIKARAACAALGCPALADDSGLCVDGLNGAPGVFSARYCGYHGSDEENRKTLLRNMQGVKNRKAHFTSAIALVYPDGQEFLAEGYTYGSILQEEEGNGGFGYDPLFFSDDLQKSFGVASAEEKNAVSHRFRALQAMLVKWREAGL
ncbi:MAG: RdgB/HAM1 family non-canonical purine NTP pyrophosphatase [Clostridiales bacterium]|nr:RdgB/HAM1 family non-canonical purine NTP pyrophosphatase [Clostridiales bacterium]